jgi:hypothetical protein
MVNCKSDKGLSSRNGWLTFDVRVGFDKIFQSGLPAGSLTLLNNATYDNRALAPNTIELLRGKLV